MKQYKIVSIFCFKIVKVDGVVFRSVIDVFIHNKLSDVVKIVRAIPAKQDVASILCYNLDHYTEWLSLHIFVHKIVSLTIKFGWKTQKSEYKLETKLANCEATTEICNQDFYFLSRPQKFDTKMFQLVWILLTKRQINFAIFYNFCGLLRMPEL
jgi:hypothetical protein